MGVPPVVVVQRGASSPALSRRRILRPMPRSILPKIVPQDRILQGAVEQILDVPVLEKAEWLAEVPKIVSQGGIQQRTVDQTFDILVPQDVEEPAEFFKTSSKDRVQLRFGIRHSLKRSLRYPSFIRKKRRDRV